MKDPRSNGSYTLDELYKYGQSIEDMKEARVFLDSLDPLELVLIKRMCI